MQNFISQLEAEVQSTRKRLEHLEKALEQARMAISPFMGNGSMGISASAISKDHFARFKGGMATREFLRYVGKPTTEAEIVKGLLDGGWDGGKYPARAVSLSISNNGPQSKDKKWFVRKGDLVYLTEWL